MYKLLTAVVLLTVASVGHTMDISSFDPNIDMKQVIRSKLWYQGVEVSSSAISEQGSHGRTLPKNASEELIVALDKYEQF